MGCADAGKKPPVTPASQTRPDEREPSFFPPVNLMKDQGPDSDGVVRIVGEVTCTGTMIAEDLVLTAHHCVSARDRNGRVVNRDLPASEVSVELGGDYLPWGEVSVRALVTPECGYRMGKGDIAILVLSRKLIGIPTVVPRLDSAPERGESVVPVGFGRCSLSPDAIHRVVRDGGAVAEVRDTEFVGIASICPGDSGAPAYDAQSEVLGVVSASVMDGDDSSSGVTVYTRLDTWRGLFAAARDIAAGASESELPPFRSCDF